MNTDTDLEKKGPICDGKAVSNTHRGASEDNVVHQLFVRQKVEAGLADLNAGRRHSHDAIKREFGVK